MSGLVRDGDLRDEDWVIAIWSEDDLIDDVRVRRDALLQVAHAEDAIEGCGGASVVRTEYEAVVVRQEADSSSIAIFLRAEVVEELWTAFILTNLYMAVVGSDGNETVVAYLMHMVGGRAPNLVDRQYGERVSELIAGISVGGEAVGIVLPTAKVSRAIGISCSLL